MRRRSISTGRAARRLHATMSRALACLALALPLWLLCWSSPAAEASPLFGLFNLLGGSSLGNSSSGVGALAAAHLQHKLDTLNALSDLLAIGINITGSSLG